LRAWVLTLWKDIAGEEMKTKNERVSLEKVTSLLDKGKRIIG
jgi:hypothetical protein